MKQNLPFRFFRHGVWVVCVLSREMGQVPANLSAGVVDSVLCRCKGPHCVHGDMFAKEWHLRRCSFYLKSATWRLGSALCKMPAPPHHCGCHWDHWDLAAGRLSQTGKSWVLSAAWTAPPWPKISWGTTTKCLVWRPAEVDAAYQSLEPSSGAFLDYWMETSPKNTNSIWLIQKGLWVTHARSRPATMKIRLLVFQYVTKATKNPPWKWQMRHRGRCQHRMLEPKEFGLELSLCHSVCSTLWFLIESSWDFKRKAEPPNLKPQILFWWFL